MPAPVAVVGDCLLDVGIRPAGPIQPGADVPARIELGPGGSAANVAVRLARAGLPVRLLAPLAADPAGILLKGSLAAEGVEPMPLAATRTGVVAILVADDGERTMLSQRPPFPDDAAQLLSAGIRDARWIHVSGYALLDRRGAQLTATLGGRRGDVPLAIAAPPLTGSSAGGFRELLVASRPNVVFANAQEAALLLGRPSVAPRAKSLAADLADVVGCAAVVTQRRWLAAALPEREPVSVDVPDDEPQAVDSTGAGDAVAATVTAELLHAGWPPSREALASALSRAATLAAQVAAAAGAQAPVPAERRPGAGSGAPA